MLKLRNESKEIRRDTMSVDKIKNIILEKMFNILDFKKMNYLFSGHISLNDFIMQVSLEVLKDNMYESYQTKSLRQWLIDYNKELEYQSFKRTIKYTNYYKTHLIQELEYKFSENKIQELKGLELADMSTIDKRIEGYRLNEFHFMQLDNINKYELIKTIISKKICYAKKVKNAKFVELYNEIDKYYFNLKQEDVTQKRIKNMIDFYEIEKNYSTEIIYKIAAKLIENGVEEEFDLTKFGLLFTFNYPINKTNIFSCENRFLAHRHLYIDDIISPKLNKEGICEETEKLINILYLKSILNKEIDMKKTILESNRDELIKILYKNYPLFSINEEKHWDNKKIRIARNLFNNFYKEVENPKIRT